MISTSCCNDHYRYDAIFLCITCGLKLVWLLLLLLLLLVLTSVGWMPLPPLEPHYRCCSLLLAIKPSSIISSDYPIGCNLYTLWSRNKTKQKKNPYYLRSKSTRNTLNTVNHLNEWRQYRTKDSHQMNSEYKCNKFVAHDLIPNNQKCKNIEQQHQQPPMIKVWHVKRTEKKNSPTDCIIVKYFGVIHRFNNCDQSRYDSA